jgi:hypothetical protein
VIRISIRSNPQIEANSMATEQRQRTELDEWRQRVEELYGLIRVWALEMVPIPTFELQEITLVEKWSGEYRIPQLMLAQGQDKMLIRPVARAVIGADGRVDLLGLDGPFTLFLHEVEVFSSREDGVSSEWRREWYWVQDRAPWESVPLDGPLFRELAESCLR